MTLDTLHVGPVTVLAFDDQAERLRDVVEHPGTFLPTLFTFMLLAAGASLAEKRRRVG